MSDETIQWKLFPFSLVGKAKHWYKLNVERAQGDWKTLYNEFLSKFFPISKVVALRIEVVAFRQLEEESPAESWDRLTDLILTGSDLGILDPVLLQHFYEGLRKDSRESLNMSSGGSFLHVTASEAMATIERIVSAVNIWSRKHSKLPRKKGFSPE